MSIAQGGSRPYVDRPIADGVAAARVAARAAADWELPEPELLRVGMNAIFRAGTVVLRVAAPTAPAAVSILLAEALQRAGVGVLTASRSEVLEAEGLSVTAWPYVEITGEPIDWQEVGRSVRAVHGLDPAALPDGLPTPSPTDFAWWDFDRLLTEVGSRLDAPARSGIEAAIEQCAGWDTFTTADSVVCHGDVHPGNVMQTVDGPLLIDWDLLCIAPRGWDHSPLMTWTERWGGPSGIYEAFADGYGVSMRGDAWADRFAELRLVAATLMRVRAAMRDESAWSEADRRLEYWRGAVDAPPWRAL